MDTPLVTVVVPLYNKAKQIARCLESLKNQTYSNYIVLVIDDGSTDNSFDIASKYQSEHIKILRKKNGGVSSARNFGIENAIGDYIAFVDSDDWVDKNYIGDFFKLGKYSAKSIGIQAIETVQNNKIESLNSYDDIIIEKTNLSEGISKYNLLHTGYPFAKLYSLELIKKQNIRFIEELPTHEDHVFVWTYMQYIESIILIAAANYKYIIDENPESLSKSLYTPEVFLKASDQLINAMNGMKTNLQVGNRYYKRAITDYGLTQRVRAILSAYIKGYDKKYRINLLRREFKINRKIYQNYKSKRRLQDWVLKLMSKMPTFILDKMLLMCIKLLGLKDKEVRLFIK